MFIAPPITDPTLEALREILREQERNQTRRKYLGASSVGHTCERNVWYSYHCGHLAKPMNDMGHLAVNCGHRAEATMATLLRLIPDIELITEQENGEQLGFSDHGGEFKGHIDGIIRGLAQAPVTPHIWEHKDANAKKFAEFQKLKEKHGEKECLKHWNWIYHCQAQVYMHYFDLTRHYMTVSLSGVRDFDSCRTEYDKNIAQGLVDKAKRVIEAKAPPARISNKPDFWTCKFCNFNEVCHEND